MTERCVTCAGAVSAGAVLWSLILQIDPLHPRLHSSWILGSVRGSTLHLQSTTEIPGTLCPSTRWENRRATLVCLNGRICNEETTSAQVQSPPRTATTGTAISILAPPSKSIIANVSKKIIDFSASSDGVGKQHGPRGQHRFNMRPGRGGQRAREGRYQA